MKKSIFLALLVLCTITTNVFAGDRGYRYADPNAPVLTKQAILNRMQNIPDKHTKFFNWSAANYYILFNDILVAYSKQQTGVKKEWTNEEIFTIVRDSTVIVSPAQFAECWQTCGRNVSVGSVSFGWDTRDARVVGKDGVKEDEMFLCIRMKSYYSVLLPIASLNCGNGVRFTCVERIVFEQPEREIPNLGDDVREYEPVETVEYEYVYEDVTPPEIHTTVIRRQPDVIQQQVVCNNEPQQPVCQNPPQNRLAYNYYGGGNNAGWGGGGFQQPSSNYNQQSWANNQSATSNNVNDNSNVFNNNTNVSYPNQQKPPNTANQNNYTSGSPASVPGSNGLVWGGPGGVPPSGNNGGPVGVPGNGGPAGVPGSGNYGPGFSSGGGPSGAGGSGRLTFH